MRLNVDYDRGESFRPLIENRNKMISPSLLWRSADRRLQWEGQYTWENRWYVPDRGPARSEIQAMGLPFDYGFARRGDHIDNTMQMATSRLEYELRPQWKLQWTLARLSQHHDFDHFYLGTFNRSTRMFNPPTIRGWIKSKSPSATAWRCKGSFKPARCATSSPPGMTSAARATRATPARNWARAFLA